MASVAQRRSHTLQYFDQFDYPLTTSELNFWLHSDQIPPTHAVITHTRNYLHLKNRSKIITTRMQREKFSQKKWPIARQVCQLLNSIPTIQAVFVTGALAMNNCPENDDIDIMIVTQPYTLWLTRLLVYDKLNGLRRPPSLPEHSSARVANKICDNLYLDASHLHLQRQNLYTAHEILQAKSIIDKNHIHQRFLQANPWVENFIPNAYRKSKKTLSTTTNHKHTFSLINLILYPLNFICFILQYLYMKPKITNEHISLHTAFFHPRQTRIK